MFSWDLPWGDVMRVLETLRGLFNMFAAASDTPVLKRLPGVIDPKNILEAAQTLFLSPPPYIVIRCKLPQLTAE